MPILDDIYDMFIETAPSPVIEKEYKQHSEAASALKNVLYAQLTPEQRDIYEQFTNAQAKAEMYYERRFFAQSVAFGAALMLELAREEL